MHYAVFKYDRHLRTRGKYRKHEPETSVFFFFGVFLNVRSVLFQLLYDIGEKQ